MRHRRRWRTCQSSYDDAATQGPIVAFNLRNETGGWVSNAEVEKLAAIKNFHLRTGGLCNPGGIAASLNLAPWEMHENFSAGQRCGNENDIMQGKPTGMIRISLGAMSTMNDVNAFIAFVREFFIQKESLNTTPSDICRAGKGLAGHCDIQAQATVTDQAPEFSSVACTSVYLKINFVHV